MHLFAVVPIFTNVGVALLPTILAALGSAVAILFSPKALWKLCARRPWATCGIVGSIASCVVIAVWLFSNGNSTAAERSKLAAPPRYDWVRIAERIIAQEHAGRRPSSLAATATSSSVVVDNPKPVDEKSKPAPIAGGESKPATEPVETKPPDNEPDRNSFPSHMQPLWSFQPEDTMFLGKAAAMGNRVYVAGSQADLGSFTGILACLDAETGKPIWQVTQLAGEPLPPFFSSPALAADGKRLIVGQGLHEDRNCSLLCFDTAGGQLIWSVKTPLHIESSPAVFGDLAVVGAGAIEGKNGKPEGDPGFVLAVRISDGKELWRYALNDPESSPAIDADGIVYIGSGFNGNAVVALRSQTDDELAAKNLSRLVWRAQTPVPVTSPATLAGDLVLFGAGNSDVVHSQQNAQGMVVAIERKTGNIRWQKQFEDGVLGAIAVCGDKVACPVRTGEVVALSLENGQVVWHRAISGAAPVMAGCVCREGKIAAVSSNGYLAILDAADGSVLEKCYLNDQSKPGTGLSLATPLVHDGKIIVGSETGGVRMLVGEHSSK
ncbi:MAG TPA: PQQ-binding-like beta-propeller repeat protein [Pirellulales bacterium]|jgi:outer membrane protein assembly factor BamB